MVAKYFKKKRELVEIFVVSGSGLGIIFMTILLKCSVDSLGWRYVLIYSTKIESIDVNPI